MLLGGNYELNWNIGNLDAGLNDPDNYIEFMISVRIGSATNGWIGIGFGEGQYMQNKDIIKAMWDRDAGSDEQFFVIDCYSAEWFPVPDVELDGGTDNIYDVKGEFIDDQVVFNFKRPLIPSDKYDYPIYEGYQHFIAAFQINKGFKAKHDTQRRTVKLLQMYKSPNNIRFLLCC